MGESNQKPAADGMTGATTLVTGAKKGQTAGATKNKNKKKKGGIGKWIALGIVVLIVAFIVYSMTAGKQKAQTTILNAYSTTPLARTSIEDSVNVSGTVESKESEKVYTTLTGFSVADLDVEVGDEVQTGQLLCKLDTLALESQISQQEAAISASASATGANINSAQTQYSTAREQLTEERSAAIVSAQSAIDSSQTAYDSAQKAYDDAQLMFDLGDISESELTDASNSLFDAQSAVDDAQKALEDARKTSEDSVKIASDQVKSAQAAGSTESQQIAVEEMRRQLGLTDIYSPISGTVTFVNVEKGATAAGLLFVIEDLDDMIVKTKLREYDAPSVHTGMRVRIKSDATGDEEFYGTVSYIAPTAVKSQTGEQIQGGTVEFEAEITIDSATSGDKQLRVGMNTQLYIIVDEVSDVFAVTYAAVYQDANGGNYIYVKETDAEGKETVRSIQVTTGIESDYMIEVSSPELQAGMEVIDAPSDYLQQQQQLGLSSAGSSAQTSTSPEMSADDTAAPVVSVGTQEG